MRGQGIQSVALALTGASGAQYGLRLLEQLLVSGRRVQLMISKAAQVVIGLETSLGLPGRPADVARFFRERHGVEAGRLEVYGAEQWTAPIASGSAVADAMVVCPCTMATVSALAHGSSSDLIERAGDVALKERRPLIVVPRETPLSLIHLENLLRLARAGATILPANPGFYHRPDSIDGLVDFVVARVLDHLGVAHTLVAPWGEPPETP